METYKQLPYRDFTSRWGGETVQEKLGPRIERWLKKFSEEERPILLELLAGFCYYSEERIKESVKKLYTRFCEAYPDDRPNTVYTKIYKEYGTSYSDILFGVFWLENDLGDSSEPNILGLLQEETIPSVLAIVDDFSGTGKTFIKTVKKLQQINQRIAESTIYFLTLHITPTAREKISTYSRESGITIRIVALDESDKAFKSGNLYHEIDAVKKRNSYSKVYRRFGLLDDYCFGFGEIEALVAFYYNTPNNTLGIFWQDLADFSALFPRHRKKQTTLRKMQADAKRRRDSRACTAVGDVGNNRDAAFIVYCVTKGNDYSQQAAMDDFGFTAVQLNETIKRIIQNGYLIYQDGTFCPTEKLKSCMIPRRFKEFEQAFSPEHTVMEFQFNAHEEYLPVNFH